MGMPMPCRSQTPARLGAIAPTSPQRRASTRLLRHAGGVDGITAEPSPAAVFGRYPHDLLAERNREGVLALQEVLFQGTSDDQNTLAGMHDGARHQASEPGNARLLLQESAHGVDTVGLWRQGTRAE